MFGFPLEYAKTNNIEWQRMISNFDFETYLVQNEFDPEASAIEIKKSLLDEYKLNWDFGILPGDSHYYEPNIIKSFLK